MIAYFKMPNAFMTDFSIKFKIDPASEDKSAEKSADKIEDKIARHSLLLIPKFFFCRIFCKFFFRDTIIKHYMVLLLRLRLVNTQTKPKTKLELDDPSSKLHLPNHHPLCKRQQKANQRRLYKNFFSSLSASGS